MTTMNAIRIGKSLASLLDVENETSLGIICTHHLRIRVEIDTLKPLVPGIQLPRSGRSSIWVRYLYGRLADYCLLYGLIGHRKNFCSAPPPQGPHNNYGISLRAFVVSGPSSKFINTSSPCTT